jgi:N-acetylglutamate synthase-like GNAT family acetyltransferase
VPVHTREATDRDAGAIAALLGQLGYPSSREDVVRRMTRMAAEPGGHALVAELDGAVVGLATVYIRHLITLDAPLARLASMVVDETVRSQGVGEQLVRAAEAIARAAGCDRMEVTSNAKRTRAHAFYFRLGYEERPKRFIKPL